MSVTEDQATRLAGYYEARKPYTELLFKAIDNAPANVTDTEKGITSDKPQAVAEGAQPQPGAHFAELVELLKESEITEREKKGPKRKL